MRTTSTTTITIRHESSDESSILDRWSWDLKRDGRLETEGSIVGVGNELMTLATLVGWIYPDHELRRIPQS